VTCVGVSGRMMAALAGRASDAERLELETHLDGCADCRREHASYEGVRRLRGWEPAGLGDVARERVRRALPGLLERARRAPPARPARWWWAVGALAVAAALAWLWWPRDQAAVPARPTLSDGAELRSTGVRVLTLGPAAVELGPGTVLTWRAARSTIELAAGRVTVDIEPGRGLGFQVATARFVARVKGTRFTVTPEAVTTERGVVEVIALDGHPLGEVAAGEAWSAARATGAPPRPPPAADSAAGAAPAADSAAGAAPHPAAADTSPRARDKEDLAARLAEARRELGAGRAAAARRLFESLTRAPAAIAVEARLGIAESFLVEGRYEEAIGAYRAVMRAHGTTPQAEAALYAIAQLESESGSPADAGAALERYLARYPRGRFAREARERLSRIASP